MLYLCYMMKLNSHNFRISLLRKIIWPLLMISPTFFGQNVKISTYIESRAFNPIGLKQRLKTIPKNDADFTIYNAYQKKLNGDLKGFIKIIAS